MAKIVPFRAIRPSRDKVSLVASRSYLSYSKEILLEKLENNIKANKYVRMIIDFLNSDKKRPISLPINKNENN